MVFSNLEGERPAPKAGALPTALHPVIEFFIRLVVFSQTRRDTNFAIPGYLLFSMIPRRGVKIKFFLSVVIPVVKAAFVPFSATGGNPANAGVARLCGVSPHPVPDTATALPKQARYQLRYTRLYIVGLSGRPIVYPTARPFSRAFCTGGRKKL